MSHWTVRVQGSNSLRWHKSSSCGVEPYISRERDSVREESFRRCSGVGSPPGPSLDGAESPRDEEIGRKRLILG
jgi:hypothetical protein